MFDLQIDLAFTIILVESTYATNWILFSEYNAIAGTRAFIIHYQ